jgi:hypothetical protein
MRNLVTLFALLLSTAAVLADTRIEYKATEGAGASLNTILIGQGKVRSDADQNIAVILDPAAGTMTMVDNGKKTFTRITRADLQQLAKSLEDAMKQMEQALASVPPEMRDMMKGRMGGMANAGGPPAVTEDTGQAATVAGKSCRVYRTTVQGKPTAEYCMADASAIDIPAADRATMAAAMAWSKELTDALAKGPMGRLADATPFRAGMVPLRTTTISASGERRTSEFVGVTTNALAADLFAVPAGYKEQKLEIPKIGK